MLIVFYSISLFHHITSLFNVKGIRLASHTEIRKRDRGNGNDSGAPMTTTNILNSNKDKRSLQMASTTAATSNPTAQLKTPLVDDSLGDWTFETSNTSRLSLFFTGQGARASVSTSETFLFQVCALFCPVLLFMLYLPSDMGWFGWVLSH
mgnify:CR=1 FL=1